MSSENTVDNAQPVVELDAGDLPAHCPNPKMPLWSGHPRVYIHVTRDGKGQCPYCGTVYVLRQGAVVDAH